MNTIQVRIDYTEFGGHCGFIESDSLAFSPAQILAKLLPSVPTPQYIYIYIYKNINIYIYIYTYIYIYIYINMYMCVYISNVYLNDPRKGVCGPPLPW